MKLFVVLPKLSGGGLERMRLNMLPEFVAAGAEVFLVVGKFMGELIDCIPPNVTVLEIASKGRFFLLPGLHQALRKYRPTHILSAGDDVNGLCILANKISGVDARIVVSCHSMLSRQVRSAKGLTKLKLRTLRLVMTLLYPMADQVVAVSQSVADDIALQLRLSRSSVLVIYNPTITSDFEDRRSAPVPAWWSPGNRPMILFVGRLSPEKRPDLLVEAFKIARERHPMGLAIVGAGPMEPSLRAMVAEKELSSDVIFHGFLSNVLPIINGATILVLPSDYEGLPNVIIEAMACGTQVIATDSPGGTREVLEGGRFGKLVSTGDAMVLAEAIIQVLTKRFFVPPPDLRRRALEFTAARSGGAYIRALFGEARSTVAPLSMDDR
jgi:glycosyltransferase involved in cell wall biosynthesis